MSIKIGAFVAIIVVAALVGAYALGFIPRLNIGPSQLTVGASVQCSLMTCTVGGLSSSAANSKFDVDFGDGYVVHDAGKMPPNSLSHSYVAGSFTIVVTAFSPDGRYGTFSKVVKLPTT